MLNLNPVKTTITIAGKACYFVHLKLNQSLNAHHTFEIKVNYEELDSQWMANPIKMFQLIGGDVGITMQHSQTGEMNIFKGTITNVAMTGEHATEGNIIVSGCSPTIKLDGTPTMDSFMDLDLKTLVQESVDNSGNGAEVDIKPVFNAKIDFLTQHNESCFQFLNRLSWLYGEWFGYSGTEIFFGKPDLGDVASVTYDTEMTHFDFSASLIPPKVNRFDYLTHDVNEVNSDAPDRVDGVRGYIKVALDQSDKVYTSDTTRPLEASILSKKALDDLVKVDKYRAISQMLTMRGRTQTCKVKIAKLISVGLPKNMEVPLKDVETFLVTQVTHEANQDGTYFNTFTAIPSEMENIPMFPIKEPIALPQVAWVKSNADDRGRVKVEFQWQKKINKTTNWIRVATLDGGGTAAVPKNRGFVFIPEEGDQVMVNFENGDPNRPYVSSSIFSENMSEGGKENNAIKAITTRSGIKVVFNDDSGLGSLHISDPSGNTWDMDGCGNIVVNAINNLELKATNIQMHATNNLEINVTNTMISNIMTANYINTPYFKQVVSGRSEMFSSNAIIYSTNSLNIESKKLTSIGKDQLLLHSQKEAILNSKGVASMHGKEKSSFTNSPLDADTANDEEINKVIVEFRPKTGYKGEFGFDWLRMGDYTTSGGGAETYNASVVLAQYKSGVGMTAVEHSAADAFKNFSEEYDIIPIKRTPKSKYYIPFLNIFPKDVSVSAEAETPPTFGELELYIDIEGPHEPDKIEIEFSDSFSVGGKTTDAKTKIGTYEVKDKAIGGKRKSTADGIVKVECLKELNSDENISVYAYPKKRKGESDASHKNRRFLAGRLKVLNNKKSTHQKIQKILLINVKTKIRTTEKTGNYDADPTNIKNLYTLFYQSLVYPEVEECPDTLDLSDVDEFIIRPIDRTKPASATNLEIIGDFVTAVGELKVGTTSERASFITKLKDQFLKIFTAYDDGTDYLFVFYLENAEAKAGSTALDTTSFLFSKMLYVGPGKNPDTLGHEGYHALNLHHTHIGVCINGNVKYRFSGGATDNIMSYNHAMRKSTFKWQWDKIHAR